MSTPMVILALAIIVVAARIGWQEGKRQGFEQGLKDAEELQRAAHVERIDCLLCGAENSVTITREPTSGHMRGVCEKCGARYME